ncbi:putative pectinesterase precursor [Exidia glandulosa HHB12029]|uniref:pectinesterase n=1 Tax=Exidia glandulosa HHB12029 TaxID=1314781 RepID=A0A165FG52_EXIGL|nr:putative pectinesterase precursor [Exidia glandulosa HHB12029]
MSTFRLFTILLASATVTVHALSKPLALSKPPAGAITVGPTGSGAQYTDLNVALNDTSSNVFFVFSGTWTTQIAISRANVTIFGQTHTAKRLKALGCDASSYEANTVTFTNNIPASAAGSNDKSGTVRVLAEGVKLYNLNIANTYGKPVDQAQAIALSVQKGKFGCYGCKLTGDQDTLLANTGTQFYAKSFIQGHVDFIFGRSGSIWITNSVIDQFGDGYFTASGRQTDDANWYVIDNSVVQGNGTSYLGRPWGAFARVVYQNSNIGSAVPAVGWSIWNVGDERTSNVTFAEFNNTGPGAWNEQRASFATLLTAPIDILTVLNSTSWIDPAFL